MTPSPPARGHSAWTALPRWLRAVLVVLAVVVVVEFAQQYTAVSSPGQGAPAAASSSFSTGSAGTAALTRLLRLDGHRVVQRTAALSGPPGLPPGALFVVGPGQWSSADSRAVLHFADRGGRVVVAGPPPAGLLGELLGPGRPRLSRRDAGTSHPVAPGASGAALAGVGRVRSGGGHSWSALGGTRPLLRGPGGWLATEAGVGRGSAVLVASAGPFQNRLLAEADDARFALDLAGPPGTAVTFDEHDHGYGQQSGLGALPVRWKWGLGLALLAVLVWMLSRARRFGPPDEAPRRGRVPPRIAYVDGLAALLAASGARAGPAAAAEAAAPVLRRARRLLDRRLGGEGAGDAEAAMVRAARAGVPEPVAAAVLSEPLGEEDVLAVGRALAWLETEGADRR